MENSKEIPEVSTKSQLSREYLLALGSIGHYIKQVEQYHESQQTEDPLPPRWLRLAERSLLHRPIMKYREYFNSVEFQHPDYSQEVLNRLEYLDQLVESFNSLLQQEGILAQLKEKDSGKFSSLKEIYAKAKQVVTSGLTDQ